MKTPKDPVLREAQVSTNGSGAGAILSAAIGCLALSVSSILADKSAAIKSSLAFYKPTGPLSGVTTCAIAVWLFSWMILEWRWGRKVVAAGRINAVALGLLALSFVLTIPPVSDIFQK